MAAIECITVKWLGATVRTTAGVGVVVDITSNGHSYVFVVLVAGVLYDCMLNEIEIML